MDDLKTMADGSAVTLGLGTFMNYVNLPLIIQILTIAWLILRIWESATVRRWFKKDVEDFAMGDVPNIEEEAVITQTKKTHKKKGGKYKNA